MFTTQNKNPNESNVLWQNRNLPLDEAVKRVICFPQEELELQEDAVLNLLEVSVPAAPIFASRWRQSNGIQQRCFSLHWKPIKPSAQAERIAWKSANLKILIYLGALVALLVAPQFCRCMNICTDNAKSWILQPTVLQSMQHICYSPVMAAPHSTNFKNSCDFVLNLTSIL